MKTLVIKQTLLTCLLFLSCTGLQAQERIVEQPAFDAWSSTTLEIDKIALSDTATVFYIDAYFRPKYWIQVVKETTLRADGKTYPIKAGDGITLSEKFWMPESGEASFRLIFPPLPKGTKTVDFIEGDEEGAFKIWNIHLDGSPANSSLAGKKNPAETPVLEKPEFKNGTAVLKGHIADYKPEMNLKGRAWNFNLLNGSTEEYNITVQPDGNFTLEVPLYYPTGLNIVSNFMNGLIYLKPGETTSVEINMPEICRSQSKKQKDKPSLGEKYYFTGALAALNNECSNSSLRFVSVSPKSQEDYMQMFSDISTMNADQFKAYWMDRYQKEYELPAYDAGILTESRHLAGLFEETAVLLGNPKKVANWFMVEVLRLTKDKGLDPEKVSFTPKHLADLLSMVEKKEVSAQNAKKVFEKVFDEDIDPVVYIEENGLKIVEDTGLLTETVKKIVDANPGPLAELLGGKDKVMGFFVGQLMRELKGKANPDSVRKALAEEIERRR